MIQITQFEGQHSKEQDCKELSELIKFAEDNNIDIDLEPPKKFMGYIRIDNGNEILDGTEGYYKEKE